MNQSTVGHNGAFRCRRVAHVAPYIGLVALALPAHAQTDVLGQMDRQVVEIVNRVKPSVVSVRVSGPRKEQSTRPSWGEDELNSPFFDANTQIEILPAALIGDQGCGSKVGSGWCIRGSIMLS